MSLKILDVQKCIQIWAQANVPSGVPVIFAYENAPRPQQPYVSIYLSTFTQIGQDFTPEPTDDAGDVVIVGDREFTMQISAYAGDCWTVLENLRSSLQRETVLDSLRASGIAFVSSFPIQSIPELVGSTFEQRTQMDVLFRIGQQTDDVLGSVATVEVEEIISNAVEVVFDETITIPAP